MNSALASQLARNPYSPSMQMGQGQVPPGAPFGLNGWGQGLFNKPQGDPSLPYFQEDRTRLGGLLNGMSPFASGQWDPLIQQLSDTAAGRGPSVAEQTYRGAAQDTANSIGSMSRGSASPSAARFAAVQAGRVGQGMAAGAATARTQEMQGAQSALTQALSQRDQINQGAYLDILGKQLGLSKDQLQALLTNAQIKQQRDAANKQASAAKWQALGGGAAALAML